MAKTYSNSQRRDAASDRQAIFIALEEIYICESTVAKLLKRDHAQIEQFRENYENGEEMVPVILRQRFGGGYNIEEGRHRVIAAKLAGETCIEAFVVGS